MKRLFILLSILCYSCSSEERVLSEATMKAVKDSPVVKEAIYTDADVLYVSVIDDGTKRDGLADSFCQIIKNNGESAFKVKIVKYNSTNDPNRANAYGVLLGESTCQ